MRPILALTALAGCSEYNVSKSLGAPEPTDTTPTTPPSTESTEPTEPTTVPPEPTDTGTPPVTTAQCYAPEFGYQSSPEAMLVTTDSAQVTVTLLSSDAGYQNTLMLTGPELCSLIDAWSAPLGTAVTVGPYPAGTELVFGLLVNDTGDKWRSGPASRNADHKAHVAVTYDGACVWDMGFEDKWGGGDQDFNDVAFRVEGLLVQQ